MNISHRDLKPENILLDENKNIKLIDFGLSNVYEKEELLNTACGSPCYAAPEMIAGRKYQGLLVDIWSSGVILFAMVCGFLPFDHEDTKQLYKKILKGHFKMPDYLSNELKDLLLKILQTNPEKRIGLSEIRQHKWFKKHGQFNIKQKGVIVGYHQIPIDNEIILKMKQNGQNQQKIIDNINSNKHNQTTTVYYLLLKKKIKQGFSEADMCCLDFEPKKLEIKEKSKSPTNLYSKRKRRKSSSKTQKKTTSRKRIVLKRNQKLNEKITMTTHSKYNTSVMSKTSKDKMNWFMGFNPSDNTMNNKKNIVKQYRTNRSVIKTSKYTINMPININNLNKFVSKREIKNYKKRNKSQNQTLQQKQKSNTTSKNNSCSKSTESKNKSYKSAELDQMKTHKGPTNLNSITINNPFLLLRKIKKKLIEMRINYTQPSSFTLRCQKGNLKFQFQISKLENFPKLFVLKFFKNSIKSFKFVQICQEIFNLVNFKQLQWQRNKHFFTNQ